ncbi:MAG: endonuclease [Oscillospiraceae bacterium]|nr:endonuclease [Oscillospiraceae bacterium]
MKRTLPIVLVLCVLLSLFSVGVSAASAKITTTPTGYTGAGDVKYVTGTDGWIANWGARGETCGFLSPKAVSFYTGSYTYDTLSANSGGTGTSDAYTSNLYKALQNMMKSEHSYETSYESTKEMYAYTDCVSNDTSKLSSFYSGGMVGSAWVSGGTTYNREHTWPKSKCLGKNFNDKNDVMMLRPTIVSENRSRDNTAYGESSGYFDPGVSVRGDCARIVLYVYVRWGNTKYMWGKSGVIENLNVLLKWMQEDPVDTWEMGRNDAVASITGTRNVFVDYPEYAWLLFGKEIPSGMTTPSGEAKGSTGGSGGTGGTVTGCTHSRTELRNVKEATCAAEGYTGDTCCALCGKLLSRGQAAPKSSEHTPEAVNAKPASCGEAGYSGDTVCSVCGEILETGTALRPTGGHNRGDWVVVKKATETETGLKERVCIVCGAKETKEIPMLAGATEAPGEDTDAPGNDTTSRSPDWLMIVLIAAGCCILIGGGVILIIFLKTRRKKENP